MTSIVLSRARWWTGKRNYEKLSSCYARLMFEFWNVTWEVNREAVGLFVPCNWEVPTFVHCLNADLCSEIAWNQIFRNLLERQKQKLSFWVFEERKWRLPRREIPNQLRRKKLRDFVTSIVANVRFSPLYKPLNSALTNFQKYPHLLHSLPLKTSDFRWTTTKVFWQQTLPLVFPHHSHPRNAPSVLTVTYWIAPTSLFIEVQTKWKCFNVKRN